MKKTFAFTLALIAVCFSARSQLTLETGDTFGYVTNWALGGPSQAVTYWQMGTLDVWLDPATVQTGDVVLVEMFAGAVGEGLIRSATFENTNHIVASASPFGWWTRSGSFRLTTLSGSVTVTNILASVSVGPFFCPCSYYYSEFVPGPRLRISHLDNTQVQLSWSTNAAGYVLEVAPQLPATGWDAVTNAIAMVGDHFIVTPEGNAPGEFYRLRKR